MATTQPEPVAPNDQVPPEQKKRNWWIWISVALVLVAAGLLIWALSLRSDLDSTQDGAKAVYKDLSAQLGDTNEDLDQTQQQLDDANQAAADAQKDAADAKQAAEDAGNATDRAEAEADQAKAEVKEAESKASIAAGCAKAYVSALGGALDGGDTDSVREQLKAISADCKAALAGA
jgi:uncharacterized protein YoxC